MMHLEHAFEKRRGEIEIAAHEHDMHLRIQLHRVSQIGQRIHRQSYRWQAVVIPSGSCKVLENSPPETRRFTFSK
jgi:hypothetical protein